MSFDKFRALCPTSERNVRILTYRIADCKNESMFVSLCEQFGIWVQTYKSCSWNNCEMWIFLLRGYCVGIINFEVNRRRMYWSKRYQVPHTIYMIWNVIILVYARSPTSIFVTEKISDFPIFFWEGGYYDLCGLISEDENPRTALYDAVLKGQVETVKFLILPVNWARQQITMPMWMWVNTDSNNFRESGEY